MNRAGNAARRPPHDAAHIDAAAHAAHVADDARPVGWATQGVAHPVQNLFLWACELDVAARKPGNVSRASPGHGMTADHFIASAAAASAPLCAPSAPVGARIEAAVTASVAVAGCNTNLGIVLLCAPLAAAAESAGDLRDALGGVLDRLDMDDAAAAFRAIALAHPGGLGRVEEHDVADPPRIGLVAAMQLAADRDRIARQYADGFADLFDMGLPAFEAAMGAGASSAAAMQRAWLELLAAHPDSHIVRKHGDAAAHSVMAEALPWRRRARRGEPLDADPGFAEWDESLKARGLNPGTTADLAVTSAFIAALAGPRTRRACFD